MKYRFVLPLSAIAVVLLITAAIDIGWLPAGEQLLQGLAELPSEWFWFSAFLVILLESIVFMGFYFPGQFFAVLLVVSRGGGWWDALGLTIAMVAAATLGSLINYELGRRSANKQASKPEYHFGSLLLAMIHINALAFYMFSRGAAGTGRKVVLLAGVLNLPYYLLMVVATQLLSEQVVGLAERPGIVLIGLSVWLSIALALDYREGKFKPADQS